MKKSISRLIMKPISRLSLHCAKKACGAASWHDVYQPKEPANLAERLSKK